MDKIINGKEIADSIQENLKKKLLQKKRCTWSCIYTSWR